MAATPPQEPAGRTAPPGRTALALVLDRSAPVPLPAQIAAGVRAHLLSGVLPLGRRLPGTRSLAAELGVSRATVEAAWDQLRAEGWLESRQGSGTWTASGVAGVTAPPAAATSAAPASATPAALAAGLPHPPAPSRPEPLVPMDAGTPWRPARASQSVQAGWRRAWRRVADGTPPRGYDDPRGLPALRVLLAERIGRLRGLHVDPDEVLVTGGTTTGLRHLLTALPLRPVGVEDPGYRAAVATVLASGRSVRDLPVIPGQMPDLTGLTAAYLTPAHQHPLGRVMPAEERIRLLDLAGQQGCLLIEDDYDSEFRYDVAPVPALAALDPTRVALLGTASKSVMPSLRLGWMVVPDHLRGPVDAFRALTHDTPPWAVQSAFAELLAEGHVDAVVRAARRAYRARAPRIEEVLAPHAQLAGPIAGMYSTWLLAEERAVEVRTRMATAGFGVNLLSTYCRSSALTGLVVGFGGPTDAEFPRALAALSAALEATA